MSHAYIKKNIWEDADEETRAAILETGEDFKAFIDSAKTERLAVKEIVRRAKEAGFCDITNKSGVKAGDKVYYVHKNKAVILSVIGKQPLSQGINVVASHIDAPHLDARILPLYEKDGFALFKTQYYGGLKKYQWVARTYAVCGVVCLTNGETVEVNVGTKENDPVFYISDMPVHGASAQMSKPAADAVTGEMLNLIVGSNRLDSGQGQRIKANILKLLYEAYGINEEDLISAEIEIVPSERCRDAGFDRSMITGFGFDDKAGAYAASKAIFQIDNPNRTALAVFFDREEVGFRGNTGSDGSFLSDFIARLCALCGQAGQERFCMQKSLAVSIECGGGTDPTFPALVDSVTSPQMGSGIMLIQHFGARGQSGGNHHNAEFTARVRKAFNESGVYWQPMGIPVDMMGGMTVSLSLAQLDMEVCDLIIGDLGVHSPVELICKSDVYASVQACKAIHENLQ